MTSIQLFAFNSAIAKELGARLNAAASGERSLKIAAPSVYQANILNWIREGKGSAIVKAVAGSGKTTTVMAALAQIPDVDLSKVRASTFHSVGFNAISKKLNRRDLRLDTGKLRRILRETVGDVDFDLYADFVCKLVAFAKGEGVGALVAFDGGKWADLIAHHDLYLESEDADEEQAIEMARVLLRRSNEAAREGDIDFDDMLYLPLLWRLRLWQNDWVFVDEAQDTNPVRRAIAKLALKPGGRLMAVGDDRQAIYGFTGASHDAMDLIRAEFNCTELPLTVSYRCPTSVGEMVRSNVPCFETAPNAAQGTISYLTLSEATTKLDTHDAILCRNTAPLITTAFALIARGVGCAVLGKDIGAGLVSLIKKQRAKGIENLESKLARWRDREVAKFTARGEEGKAETVNDRVASIEAVIGALSETERTIPKLITKLEGMFSDANGVLTLSTAHKAKGREWRRVAILRPDLMPSKWARQEWQQMQETNLQYVAFTRTLDELIFITEERAQ